MFWFKKIDMQKERTKQQISIHHMFWFKVEKHDFTNDKANFNTSYVLVQVFGLIYIFVIQINFNTSYVLVQDIILHNIHKGTQFQYIICFGSR